MNNKSPAFQFYPDKWQSHTRRLSDLAYRIYHEMICWMWQHSPDHCTISADPESISCLISEPVDRVKSALGEIQNEHGALLKKVRGKLSSNGLRKEAEKQAIRKVKNSNNAKQRWNREVTPMRLQCNGNATASKLHSSLSLSLFPSPSPNNIAIDIAPSEVKKGGSSDLSVNQPTLTDCQTAAATIGMTAQQIEAYYHARNSQGWVKGNGRPIANLKSDMVAWKNREQTFTGQSNDPTYQPGRIEQ